MIVTYSNHENKLEGKELLEAINSHDISDYRIALNQKSLYFR